MSASSGPTGNDLSNEYVPQSWDPGIAIWVMFLLVLTSSDNSDIHSDKFWKGENT